VELRQRANDGADSGVASTTSAEGGVYSFEGLASAPSDAFYYVRFTGAKGNLAAWYTFPIIYVQGSDFTVPTVEFGDVQLLEPAGGAQLTLPSTLRWNGRSAGETYRVFIYAAGTSDKPAQDSGSLGTGTSYEIAAGSLPDGHYEAVVQVRDAVAGYGQSQARFTFSVGAAPAQQPQPQPPANPEPDKPSPTESGSGDPQAQPQTEPVSEEPEGHDASIDTGADAESSIGDKPQVTLNLSADKSQVQKGETIVYKVEVENVGNAPAQGVVVTNLLPSGLAVDSAQVRTSAGAMAVDGNTVTAQVGELAPNAKVTLEIPVSVGSEVGPNISTQASAQYDGAPDPVQSNAYIAQVAEATSGGQASPPQSDPQAKPQTQPQTQPQSKPQQQPQGQPQSKPQEQKPQTQPQSKPSSSEPQTKPANTQPQQNAPMPQTGGSFPIVLAVVLVAVTLLARYLRARRPRRT
jgi:uncharacterized repeat protein (TIGR01451 family)